MRTQPHPHPNPALSLVSKLDACVWGNCWCCNHRGPLQHFGLCFASPRPTLPRLGLVRFGLVLITYATKLCQLMERGTAAGAAAFAFNRICCADYRYLDIVLALIGAQHSTEQRSTNQAHKKNKITCCVILYICVCGCVVRVCGRGWPQAVPWQINVAANSRTGTGDSILILLLLLLWQGIITLRPAARQQKQMTLSLIDWRENVF